MRDKKGAVVPMENLMRFRHNVMNVNSISAFEGIRGGMNQNCKDVYFIRLVGVNDTLVSDVKEMDRVMAEREKSGSVIYRRFVGLPQIFAPEEMAEYERFYQNWLKQEKAYISTKVLPDNREYADLFSSGLQKVLDIYASAKAVSPSMEKNFVIKMLYWHDAIFTDTRKQWNPKQSVKIVLSDIVKKQEYLFACLMTFLGCDVLLLQSKGDIAKDEEALEFSKKIILGDFAKISLPEPAKESAEEKQKTVTKPVSAVKPAAAAKPVSAVKPAAAKPVSAVKPATAAKPVTSEKTFEQLALLASSVVLIGIYDRNGKIIGSGSGIMIGKDGYILTNNHVARGGSFYSIRIEEDETVYSTDELIKYNSVLDLAVLRISRRLNPLPIYSGKKKLVRGQKVVAIGSPLGLFNSVSDGIISGFRIIDSVDMIQFTAPISHGSSGGALLNMYGEVIGISTAGFDNAQNINLAVGYESIHPFIKGFT